MQLTHSTLPPPPLGKTGWPWTEGCEQLPATMSDGSPWPKISIVTPSYGQAQYLEETIRSVLLQGYPNLEYIIIDGGSTDGSVDIIRKYEPWLAFCVSERDRGQAHAINKGMARCTGSVFAYLNSDDVFAPNVLQEVAQVFAQHPNAGWLAGGISWIDQFGNWQEDAAASWPASIGRFIAGRSLPQPAVFLRMATVQAIGPFNESLHYCFDREYWVRTAIGTGPPLLVSERLASARLHVACKTYSRPGEFVAEELQIARSCLPALTRDDRRLLERYIAEAESRLTSYRSLRWRANHALHMMTIRLKLKIRGLMGDRGYARFKKWLGRTA